MKEKCTHQNENNMHSLQLAHFQVQAKFIERQQIFRDLVTSKHAKFQITSNIHMIDYK